MDTASNNNNNLVFENGTIIGAVLESGRYGEAERWQSMPRLMIPEIVISGSRGSLNSLNRKHHHQQQHQQQQQQQRCDTNKTNSANSNHHHHHHHHRNNQTVHHHASGNNNNNHSNRPSHNEEDNIEESTALLGQAQQQQQAAVKGQGQTASLTTTSATTSDGGGDGSAALPIDVEVSAETEATGAAETGDSEAALQHDEFEQFVLNRTTSDSNILESSIYSELQYSASPTPLMGSGGPAAQQQAAPQTPSATAMIEMLNTSACSRESRTRHSSGSATSATGGGGGGGSGAKRTRRKHKSKTKCGNSATAAAAVAQRATPVLGGSYPPQYTAIFLDPHHHHHHHHLGGAAANAAAANAMVGQLASAAATSPFLNAPLSDATSFLQQQYQYYQQRPLMSGLAAHHHHHRTLLDATLATHAGDGSGNAMAGGLPGAPLNAGSVGAAGVVGVGAAAMNPNLRVSFRKWFSRPSLPFVIGILALGGVACTLGGIVLGSTGLIEHSTQYLSAALLMIGIGVSLLVISGALWRLSLPDESDECPCYRHMESCRNCNSPYCNNRLLASNYLYPEFQHRPPPPSYLTSLNECAAMGLLFHPAAQAAPAAAYSTLRMNTPPPLYRSTNSLSVYMPVSNASCSNNNSSLVPALPPASDANILPAQNGQSPLTKEFNYLELD